MSMAIYARVVAAASISSDETVLAVCAGNYDRQTLIDAGIHTAVISNVDFHAGHTDYSPYTWKFEDAENLSAADDSFDWCIVHAGLHHCGSPHRALTEMLRVARKGIIVIEARDSLLMRLSVLLGATSDYELEPAVLSNGTHGGFRNTSIPNYIYRWTEREVRKTVSSALPHMKPDIRFHYGYRLPLQRLQMSRNPAIRWLANIVKPAIWLVQTIAPRQGNEFGIIVRKTSALHPWIELKEGKIAPRMSYLTRLMDPSKYRKN